MKLHSFFLTLITLNISYPAVDAQPITGFWKGKIDGRNVELKLIKNGDSLTGTSYYYESPVSYRRYTIKGYFDDRDNSVVWWDDQLIDEKKTRRLFTNVKYMPYYSTADFNCPGGTRMYLNGNTSAKDKERDSGGPVDLQKTGNHVFNDEWDFVVDNYTLGTNDPELIDSIGRLVLNRPLPVETEIVENKQTMSPPAPPIGPHKRPTLSPVAKKDHPVPAPVTIDQPRIIVAPLSNVQKFVSRRKVILKEIPVSSDSIELRFYDNAEIDGDSIAIFLNNNLLFEHIRLTDKPYTIKLDVASLQGENELVMVAENLGSIPPNTSLMVALVDGKRYETRLESTEQTSAGIRFVYRKPMVE